MSHYIMYFLCGIFRVYFQYKILNLVSFLIFVGAVFLKILKIKNSVNLFVFD